MASSSDHKWNKLLAALKDIQQLQCEFLEKKTLEHPDCGSTVDPNVALANILRNQEAALSKIESVHRPSNKSIFYNTSVKPPVLRTSINIREFDISLQYDLMFKLEGLLIVKPTNVRCLNCRKTKEKKICCGQCRTCNDCNLNTLQKCPIFKLKDDFDINRKFQNLTGKVLEEFLLGKTLLRDFPNVQTWEELGKAMIASFERICGYMSDGSNFSNPNVKLLHAGEMKEKLERMEYIWREDTEIIVDPDFIQKLCTAQHESTEVHPKEAQHESIEVHPKEAQHQSTEVQPKKYKKVTTKFKRKTLVDEFKSILQLYPDDGQIFKEIIQNAEDAKATKVVFFYDKNDERKTTLNLSEGLRKHQGPSLFVYNDACFNDGDWKGIVSLGFSEKKKDALKVGRFGLGFKSVFHLTDMPFIASGSKFAYLDPTMETFEEEVTEFYSNETELAEPDDEFIAFHRLGPPFWGRNSSTDGTLFRFPLRQEKSIMSDVCYNQPRFEDLLERFMDEGYLTLLFLKHVSSIEVYTIEKESTVLNKVYSAKISGNCRKLCEEKKRAFVDAVHKRVKDKVFYIEEKLNHELELIVSRRDKADKSYKYVISELFGFTGENDEFVEMMTDEDLSYIPLIAIAYPLEETDDPGGHIFSGLPIPLQSVCMNGMPVHVNGFFALGQDRKDLKWKTVTTDSSNDKTVNWNIHLINELLPLVYSNLIEFLVQRSYDSIIVYKSWPIEKNTNPRWKIFLKKFYDTMRQIEFIYNRKKDTWSQPDAVMFLREKEMTEGQLDSVENFLTVVGENANLVPEAITTNLDPNVSWVTKALLQNKLKENADTYTKSLSPRQKCLLLSYAVQNQEDLNNLVALPLFQLMDGNYFPLERRSQISYYLPTCDHNKDLLPSLEKVVDLNFFTADNEFLERLKSMCDCFNIMVLKNTDLLITAVMESLPPHWKQASNPSVEWPDKSISDTWLSSISRYRQSNNISFSKLEGLPYILIEKGDSKELMKISKSQRPMINLNLSHTVKRFLKDCAICFVDQSINEKEIWDLSSEKYVVPADSQNILNQLNAYAKNVKIEDILQHYNSESNDLRQFFYKLLIEYDGTIPQFCYHLPLFEAYGKKEYYSSKQAIFVETKDIPNEWDTAFANIVRMEDADNMLVQKMKSKVWSFEDISSFVVNKLDCLTEQQITAFFEDVLGKLCTHTGSEEFMNLMFHHLKVKDCQGNCKRPCDLFEKTMKLEFLFIGEQGKFPADNYNVKLLKKFGLKTGDSVSLQDVNSSIDAIQILEISSNDLIKKVEHILHIIKENNIDQADLLDVHWIPIAKERPPSYPINLQWFESNTNIYSTSYPEKMALEKVENVFMESCQDLVGSVASVIDQSISEIFKECFGCVGYIRKPTLSLVMEHLNNLESSYTDDEKRAFYQVTINIYKYLSQNLAELKLLPSLEMKIWHGNGFIPCQNITRIKVNAVTDLSPYYYVPPDEVLTILGPILNHLECGNLSEFQIYINVLQRMAKKNCEDRVSQDWIIVFPIVRYLAEHHQEVCVERKSEIFVPIEAEELQLQSLDECYYHDFEKGINYSESQLQNYILHRNLGQDVASKLKIPSLVSKVLSGSKSNLFRPWGQKEPLTLRLQKLLEDYHDGLSIIKELIQNADDAGAKQVKFLYDQRCNDNLKTYLIDTKMKEWQGPALWVYNDQQFSEKDFENITKINAGTKAPDTTKIGKFGLGFNSVYHLTDVPSFLSGDSLVIFDPHTSYLGKAFNGEPGLRITTLGDKLSQFKDQFAVYNGVFGANIDHVNKFNGTLFRLPLRTQLSLRNSEIKQTAYTDKEMESLFQKFKESLSTIILFLKNVTLVEVYELNESAASPLEQKMLFSVEKNVAIISSNTKHTDILSAANDEELIQSIQEGNYTIPSLYLVEEVAMKTTIQNDLEKKILLEKWYNFSIIGSKETYRFAAENEGHIPCGGVSIKCFQTEDGILKLAPIDNGQIYCFLPLPIPSCVPMHVNGTFAVSKDRQSLQYHSKDDKSYNTENWNELLATDISEAYYRLLVHLKEMFPETSIGEFVSCFPTGPVSSDNVVSYQLLRAVLRRFFKSNDKVIPIKLFDKTSWIDWSLLKCPDFESSITPTSVSFLNWYYKEQKMKYNCVDLPNNFKQLLCSLGFVDEMNERYVMKTEMFKYFLSSIENPDLKQVRNEILDHLLEEKPSGDLRKQLKETLCIPTFPSGALRRPSEIVIRGSQVSKLYSDQDEVFPDLKEKHFEFLCNIGANKDNLPWNMIAERARSIGTTHSNDNLIEMHEKSKILLHLIERSDSSYLEATDYESLVSSKFLKVLQKPKDDIFSTWFGCDILFSSPNNMFLEHYKDVCSCSSLFCEDRIEENAMKLLKLDRKPPAEKMISQAKELVKVFEENPDLEKVDEVLDKLYDSLSEYISNDIIMNELKDVAFVRTQSNHLVTYSKLFLESVITITGFVHNIDRKLKKITKWKKLMIAIGVQKQVTVAEYQEVMRQLQVFYDGKPLSSDHLNEIVGLIKHLCENNIENLDKSKFFLPDRNRVLQDFHKVCYKYLPNLPEEEGVVYIHEDIPRAVVNELQVKSLGEDLYLRNANLIEDKWSEFGQHEALPTRIRNLLGGYSEPIDVFKEMFQNADDAQATEIEFILDKRQHGKEKVFSEKWIPLQGASLLVVNNGTFNGSDLVGIQSLGDGSKKIDPLTTGKYGVGFNSVYRITDCPVLLTTVEKNDIMAIFDPLLKYAEGASEKKPGSMVENAREFLKAYTDVIDSFLFNKDDKCDTTGKTMFRLPFRTEKSNISENIIKTDEVERIFKELESKIDYFLLFMRNINTVKLRIINENGKQLQTSYNAHSYAISKNKVKEFQNFTANYSNKLGKLTSLMNRERRLARDVCIKHFRDGKLENVLHWNVVEQCGFSSMKSLPTSVKNMLEQNQLHLIPKGAIAKISEENSCEDCDGLEKTLMDAERLPKDNNLVFCTLHLSVNTRLPLIINGNFILDYETRRSLWTNTSDNLNTDWNNAILKHIIVPCYLEYLEKITKDLGGTFEDDKMLEEDINEMECREDRSEDTSEQNHNERISVIKMRKLKKINTFYDLFPKCGNDINVSERMNHDNKLQDTVAKESYWNYLTREFYVKLSEEHYPLLAVFRKEEVKFCEPNQFLNYNNEPLDHSLQDIKLLEILKDAFIDTDTLPNHISKGFIQANHKLTNVSPKIVREKLVQLKDDILPENLSSWKVKHTIFVDISNVETLLKYCIKDGGEMSLENLPLCVRANNTMQCFSTAAPLYNTKFNKLIEGKEHLFLHQNIYYILSSSSPFKKDVNQDCLKDFTLRECLNLLTKRFGYILKDISKPLKLEKNGSLPKYGIRREWIRNLWHYILFVQEELRTASKETDANKFYFDDISEWSFIMAKSMKENYLLKVGDRKVVIDVIGSNNQLLVDVLRKFGVFEPFFRNLQKIYGSTNSLKDIVDALVFAYENVSTDKNALSVEDTEEILAHLEFLLKLADNYTNSNNTQIVRLKSLPLFSNWNRKISDGKGVVIILPQEFPLLGLEKIDSECNVTFLKHSEKFVRVYKALQYEQRSCTYIYRHYLFQYVDVLTDVELKTHVRHIQYCKDKNDMTESLKILKIFRSATGERRLCSEMYNPDNNIFRSMGVVFPAKENHDKEWLDVMKKLGLITELTSHDFLRFSRALQEESDLNKVERVSKLLCKELYSNKFTKISENDQSFFDQLSIIKFLLPLKIESSLEKLCHSKNSSVKKICFKNSIFPKHKFLIWTTEYVLPDYAIPKSFGHKPDINATCKDNIARRLGVKSEEVSQTLVSLNPNSVLDNIKNITSSTENLELQTATCKYIKNSGFVKEYQKILGHFYNYLRVRFTAENNSSLSQTLSASLRNISCIITGDGKSVDVPPKVLLRDNKVLAPYLNKAYESLGQYFDVLEKIGSQSMATSYHYVSLLGEIKEKIKQRTMEPNEIKLVKQAVIYLNNMLQEPNDSGSHDKLYLPTVTFIKKEEVKLTNSLDCFFVDDFSIESRLQQFDKPLMLYDYGEGRNYVNKQLIKHLPERIRPSVLSKCIKETLVQPLEFVKVNSNHISSKIKNQLVNPFFQAGLIRIANHEQQGMNLNLEKLKDVDVHVLKTIKTQFTINDEIITASEQIKKIFVQEEDSGFTIYFDYKITGNNDNNNSIYSDVADALLRNILKDLHNASSKAMYSIPIILATPPDKISTVLDDNSIRREDSDEAIFTKLGELQQPGDPVPIELHGLLRTDLSAFCVGEYVGIDRDGTGTIFFYGIIKVLDDNTDITSRMYGVQATPDESFVEQLPSFMVYKFNREYEQVNGDKDANESNDIIVNKDYQSDQFPNDFSDENEYKSFGEIIEEIKAIIKNLQNKDEKTRKATIRRLYLTWHPDKHPEKTKTLATEVFQFLQNELKKLNEGYQNNFKTWNEDTERSQTRYNKYRRDFHRNFPRGRQKKKNSARGSFSTPPRFNQKNPQPSEAKRWYKQAQYDLETATKLTSASYEWICYTAHQAAEKALKAALISMDFRRGLEEVHNLRELLSEEMSSELKELAEKLEELLKSDDSMRYPSCWAYPSTPHDQYSKKMADDAIDITSKIFQLVKRKYDI